MDQPSSDYKLQEESRRIFQSIISDERLKVPEEVAALAASVKFTGDESQPFYPVPFKCAEAQAALLGYAGVLAAAISKQRYNVDQTVEIDV
jgi:hypothetical protein